MWIIAIIVICILIILSAFFAAAEMAFVSIDRIKVRQESTNGAKNAVLLEKLLERADEVVSAIVVCNNLVNIGASILAGALVTSWLGNVGAGVGISTAVMTLLIVIFGEIIPQATFSRYALTLGARFIWLVKIFIFIFYPICAPIAFLLDKILGDEISTIYLKKELTKIIEEHENSKDSDLDKEEERILKGALSFSDKKVENIMTPRTEIFSLSYNKKITEKTIKDISNSGHSRIPVYKKDNDHIIAILYVKDLINKDWHNKKIEDIARPNVLFVNYDKKLDDLLDKFKKTRHHIFIVLNKFGGVSGLVTIEDVIEEIIGAEIVDEFDKYEDLQKVAKNKMSKIKKI